MFVWLFVVAYIVVWTVRSSKNYELGSNRRRETIRAVVIVGTLAATVMLSLLVRFAADVLSAGSDVANSAVLGTAITIACALILGYLIPKVVSRFVGTKPDEIGRNHDNRQQEDTEDHRYAQQSVPERQRPPTGGVTRENHEHRQNGKISHNVKVTAGVFAMLAVGIIVGLVIILKEDLPSRETLAKCDAWLRQQLLASPGATANADNGNFVVAHIQSQRPDSCPPSAWNPLVAKVAEDYVGNIDVQFSTTGSSRGAAATMPAEGTLRWVYSAAEGQWYSSGLEDPTILVEQPTAVPTKPSPRAAAQTSPPQTPDQRPNANSHDPDYAAFTAQRTRVAPTKAAFISQLPASAHETMSHHQWELLTTNLTAEQGRHVGYSRTKTVRDGNGQQYTCIIYADGSQVPRVNLAFHKELNYTVVRNQYDELQGNIVEATTTIGEVVAPVDWRTWASRTDKIRLRGTDATSLVRMLDEQGAYKFRLDLPNNPELSGTYDVRNLLAAMAANGITCFEGQ